MQLYFEELDDKPSDCFGGSLLGKGHPKRRRPLESTKPIHLVLKTNASVLRKNQVALKIVNGEVQRWSKRCGVTVYRWANSGNHLHLAIRIGRVHQWSKFIRSLTGSIARKLQAAGLIKNKVTLAANIKTHTDVTDKSTTTTTTTTSSSSTTHKLWQCRPYTRIVRSWKKAFKALLEYIRMNQLEALGILNARDRDFYRELHRQWSRPAD